MAMPREFMSWALRRNWFSDEFQTLLDDKIAAGSQVPPQTYQDHSCFAEGIGKPASGAPSQGLN